MNKQFRNTLSYSDGGSLRVEFDRYEQGDGIAILLTDVATGEHWAIATTNVKLSLPEYYVAVKDYSENEGMVDMLVVNGIIEPEPVHHVASGFVLIPVHKLTTEAIAAAKEAFHVES